MDTTTPPPGRGARRWIALVIFLTLVPITLLVPGLTELVQDTHGGTRFQAHLFMAINQLAGIIAVPFAMVLHRRFGHTRRWIVVLLLINAAMFLMMRQASSLTELFVWRALDGAVHLPAITFLMIAANRAGGRRRGASLGIAAAAMMVGIGMGAPLGGILIGRDPMSVYLVGAVLFVLGAVAVLRVPTPTPEQVRQETPVAGSRYRFDRRRLAHWMPLAYGFADRFLIGVFTSSFTLYLTEVHHVSAANRGMLMSLFLLPFAAFCFPAGKLADRVGWFGPLIFANITFGFVYASYGTLPFGWLAAAMVVSGILSALMFAPSLVLVSDFAKRGAGEGLFGIFQLAGSMGFLAGPLVGGVLVETLRTDGGEPRWALIFAIVGLTLSVVGVVSAFVLAPHAHDLQLPNRHGGRVAVPLLGANTPSRGGPLSRSVAAWMLQLIGWKFSGELFPNEKKIVLIVAPHTSNWDFVVGVLAKYAVGIRVTFLGKDTLFKFPLGILMRFLGGQPVDRSAAHDVVSQNVALIERSERVIIVLAPEGTRKAVPRWKSGFWHIASGAQVPILSVGLDYSKKEVWLSPLFHPTGDPVADIARLRQQFTSSMAFDPNKYIAE